MNCEIITVTYRTTEQIGPDSWNTYTDVFHFGMNNTLADVARALRARHYTNAHGHTHAEIHFHKEQKGGE